MRGPYDWLAAGDQLLAIETDPNVTGLFYRIDAATPLFVGPPNISPPKPGSYYMSTICAAWCDECSASFSSREVQR